MGDEEKNEDETLDTLDVTASPEMANSKKDIEVEIRGLIAKARSRLEATSNIMNENSTRLKTLQKGFRELKRQQGVCSRDQMQAIGQLECGIQN
mmetsp:Transcript_5938/g.9657  ORF Transcript_5938/g.9657 Transcript_5938/m.9657 type:complete len:94 (+) Transcript_5938:52-333(+)|eukprot:CAMPEP_0169066562 /NCGR_PEP_ID=MMETSP1015-20121227/3026_1 /TAXON_ID=342587 /ORGANISM="Karlodinium micrum, Strain CCMP2283" /LENGTH=93 /DNA_ID=CAMNT_0009125257 /DNA_START=48 /DNA_END=329 /DNA_ORIENTATION=-